MDLKRLANFPPWNWPPDIANTLLAVLRDREADESDHLLAAEMAGEIVAINDDLAGGLLSIVGDAAASEELRSRAALSLGPVLEQMDTDSIGDLPGLDDDSFDAPPISEHTFHRIQQTLHARYLEGDIPKEVRRRILEASVRAPADWHRDAIRKAYSSDDRDWRLTAVFAMRFVSGFDDEVVASLDDPDEEISYEAVWAAGNWEIDAAWPHVSALLTAPATDKVLLLAAIEAAGAIRPREAEPLLAELSDSEDTDIADAADNAMMMASSPFDDDFDDESEL
ncbi:MAG: hypothetical protein OXP69_06315 [Spirochaetaceae bacterium]|nr:hypothetical protein [Spirochaetaceae bacterium]